MAVLVSNKLDGPDQGSCASKKPLSQTHACASAGAQGSCGCCGKASEHASEEPLPLGQVLLVFFLPLVCAITLVISAIRFLPSLAAHPGYLALSALGVACLAVILAKIVTRGAKFPKQG